MKLPTGWTITTLGELGRWCGGGTPSKARPDYWANGTIPWVSPKDMKTPRLSGAEDMITDAAVRASATQVVEPGSVLVVTRSGILSRTLPVAINDVSVALNQDLKALQPSGATFAEYVAYYLRATEQRILEECSKDGTTVASINFDALQAFDCPLAPFNEQRRITAKLDAVFERTRTAKARLDRVTVLLEKLKRSIIGAAFRGDLTADWRSKQENVESGRYLRDTVRRQRRERWERIELDRLTAKGKPPSDDRWKAKYREPENMDEGESAPLPDGWCWSTLGEAAPLQPGYAFPSSGFRKSGVRLLKGANVRDGWIANDEVDHWDGDDCESYGAYRLRAGDIVLAMDRPVYSSGTRATKVVQLDHAWDGSLLLQRVGRFQRVETLCRDYLLLFLQSSRFREHLIQEQNGTQDGRDLPHVSAGVVDAAVLPIPPEAEQKLIAERAGALLRALGELASRTSKTAEHVQKLERAGLLKAFSGGLVAQDPSDEPALAFLNRIRAARAAEPERPRRDRSPRRDAAAVADATSAAANNSLATNSHRDESLDLVVGVFQIAGRLTATTIAEATGLDTRAVKKALRILVDGGHVCVHGRSRGVTYEWSA